MIGTPAPAAKRTAPDFNPLISKLVEIVPSGKIPTISPDFSARSAAKMMLIHCFDPH
jgi:hypothetical protein